MEKHLKQPHALRINDVDQVVVAAADKLDHVADASVDTWVTSVPFETMKHYSDDPRDLGNFQAEEFIRRLVPVIAEWRRTLKPTGSLLLNFQPQTIDGAVSPSTWLLPQAVAMNGLYIVQELWIVKTNAMPSNSPRLLKPCVERVIHAVKDPATYVVDKAAIKRPSLWAHQDNRPWKYSAAGADGGNFLAPALERLNRLAVKDVLRLVCAEDANVLPIAKTQNQSIVHPAKMLDEVAEWLIRYGSAPGGTVGDNFCGSGTSAIAAKRLGRHYVASDLNADYVAQAEAALAEVEFGSLLVDSTTSTRPRASAPRPPAQHVAHSCAACGKNFFPSKPWQRFCSRPCHDGHPNGKRRPHEKKVDTRRSRRSRTAQAKDPVHLDQ